MLLEEKVEKYCCITCVIKSNKVLVKKCAFLLQPGYCIKFFKEKKKCKDFDVNKKQSLIKYEIILCTIVLMSIGSVYTI